jgi:hypothetical protein
MKDHKTAITRQRFIGMVANARRVYSKEHGGRPAEGTSRVWINDLFVINYVDLIHYLKHHTPWQCLRLGNDMVLYLDRVKEVVIC